MPLGCGHATRHLPGSFDPLHLGHCAVIHRAARLFDEVVVAVSTNPNKTHRFSEQTRIELVREVFADEPAVVVEPLESGLIADYAERRDAVTTHVVELAELVVI